ncbi:hypothetical protein IWW50_001205, partial [Coemansia erecta]
HASVTQFTCRLARISDIRSGRPDSCSSRQCTRAERSCLRSARSVWRPGRLFKPN